MSTQYNNGSYYKVEQTSNPKELISKCQGIQTYINTMRSQADQLDNLISTILPGLTQMDNQMTAQQQQIQQQQQEINNLKQQITQLNRPTSSNNTQLITPPKSMIELAKSLNNNMNGSNDKRRIKIISEQPMAIGQPKQPFQQSSANQEQIRNSRLITETVDVLFKCTYCQSVMQSYVQLNCQHMYHESCLLSLLNQQTQVKQEIQLNCCCGTKIPTNIVRNFSLRNEAERILEQLFKNQIARLRHYYYQSIKQCQSQVCGDVFFQTLNASPYCSKACENWLTYSKSSIQSLNASGTNNPIRIAGYFGNR